MIVLYSSPGCNASRKVKNILKDREIDYIEKNIYKVLLNEKEIKDLLTVYKDCLNELVCMNSIEIGKENTLNEVYKYLVSNPSMINRPIILDNEDNKNSLEIINELKKTIKCDKKCPHYEVCGALRK